MYMNKLVNKILYKFNTLTVVVGVRTVHKSHWSRFFTKQNLE